MSKIVLWILLSLMVMTLWSFAQQPKQKLTKVDDLRTIQAKDDDIWNWIRRLNQQIQTDTLKMDGSGTTDTVYLNQKYGDKTYTVFVTRRESSAYTYTAYPLTDSCFVIISSQDGDNKVIQWMVIKK
jgi:hypothetical protein